MIYQEAKPGATLQLTLTPGYAVVALGGTITVEYSEAIRGQLRAVVVGGQRYILVDFASVIESSAVAQPLPQLRPGDLGRRDVFHQIVERHRAGAA